MLIRFAVKKQAYTNRPERTCLRSRAKSKAIKLKAANTPQLIRKNEWLNVQIVMTMMIGNETNVPAPGRVPCLQARYKSRPRGNRIFSQKSKVLNSPPDEHGK